jgi:hypothetical protein
MGMPEHFKILSRTYQNLKQISAVILQAVLLTSLYFEQDTVIEIG